MTMARTERSHPAVASVQGWLTGEPFPSERVERARRAAAAQRRFLPQPEPSRVGLGKQRWRLSVLGDVQGVGYRMSAQRRATDLGLGGWVRNQADGSVELEAEGGLQALHDLRLWCEKGPPGARVRRVISSEVPPTGSDWFEILR
jgi:acylphosphatase